MYRAPLAIAPRGSNLRLAPVLRSHGPAVAADKGAGISGAQVFDPVQIGWLDPDTRDDLDPDNADPLPPVADSLRGQNITLRPWLADDAAQMRALLDDPAVWAHLPEDFPDPLCEDKARQMIDIANLADHHQVRAVVLAGRPVGQIRLDYGLHATPDAPPASGRPEAEISYWLGRAHWGKGLGRAMVAGTVMRAFANAPGLLRLVAKVRPGNAASSRILQRSGFAPIAPVSGRGFEHWHWFGLRRQHWARSLARFF